jgi:flagellar basal body rod protein FlgG
MTDHNYSALSAALSAQQALDIVSNNLANTNTPGFKKSYARFSSIMLERDPTIMHTHISESALDMSQGDLKKTNKPLDFALKGEGFFSLKNPETGERYLTRQGNFQIDKENILVSAHGFWVEGTEGPIYIGDHPESINVDNRGVVYLAEAPFQKLKIFKPESLKTLKPLEKGLYQADRLLVDDKTQVYAQHLEGSNVSAIRSIQEVMEWQRSYEAYHRSFEIMHTMEQKLVNEMV